MGLSNSAYEVVKRAVFTERSTDLQEKENRYVFEVSVDANKVQIRKAIESIYKVHVEQVNTINRQGKLRRVRYRFGRTPKTKRAIVKVKAGETIDLI